MKHNTHLFGTVIAVCSLIFVTPVKAMPQQALNTQLFEAIRKKNTTEQIAQLIAQGAQIDATKENNPYLFYVIEGGMRDYERPSWSQTIEACGLDPALYNTPLHVAAYTGDQAVVQLLLEKGASVNDTSRSESFLCKPANNNKPFPRLPDIQSRTPLFYAARGGHDEVIDLLVSRGANQESINQALIGVCQGWCHERTDLAQRFIELGADQASKNEGLLDAAARGFTEIATLLRNNSAKPAPLHPPLPQQQSQQQPGNQTQQNYAWKKPTLCLAAAGTLVGILWAMNGSNKEDDALLQVATLDVDDIDTAAERLVTTS